MSIDLTKIQRIGNYLNGLSKDFAERGEEPKYPLKTLPNFNRIIWGLKEGMTIIGARTSQGKSSLALQIAYDLASQGKTTYFLSLEMNVESLIERLFCNAMRVNNLDLLTGRFNKDAEIQRKWDMFTRIISKIPLLITCGIGKSFQEITTVIEKLEPKPSVVVVDYIQNIAMTNRNAREMMNEYIRYFRELAITKKFVGILCSQINRTTMVEGDKEPQLHQLKESGALEEMADTILLLHWDYFYTHKEDKKNEYKILVRKQRNGRIGDCKVFYAPEYYMFYELDSIGEMPEPVLSTMDTFGGSIESVDLVGDIL